MSLITDEAVASPPAPGAGEDELADEIGLDRDGVGDAVDAGDGRGFRHHRRMDALLDAGVGAAGDAEQLDAVAELVGRLDVGRRDRRDALDIDRVGVDLGAEGDGGQQRELVGGVVAADVEGRIGLGVAEPLGRGEALGEGEAAPAPSGSGCSCRCR